MQCLELYSGIGGFAVAAVQRGWHVRLAIDISEPAAAVYRHNFAHRLETRTLESISATVLREVRADLWWMSPPCQPYTTRGRHRDLSDSRSASFRAIMAHLAEIRPAWFFLENVPGFQRSKAADMLRRVLNRAGYQWRELGICPTELGVPNRRRRFYLVASRSHQPRLPCWRRNAFALPAILDENPAADLFVNAASLSRFNDALHCIRDDDDDAVSTCFTSAYGTSPVHSGSYLAGPGGLRRFSPGEMLRCLGFPHWYGLPPETSHRSAWKLVGNSLSIFVVTQLLNSVNDAHEEALT